ncbi:MAG: serine/threonine-protein kinase, partial [Polyangiaceae bacterium]
MSGALREGTVTGGRYRLEELLGEGGFAVVWAATHVVTRRRVALKFLKDQYAADPRVRQRFLREARAASAVRHPSVIGIQDVFEEEGGRPVMVMDRLEGESLGERLRRRGALPLPQVATILLPVLAAVESAHAQGIVHRDLKPDNIFLARSAAPAGSAIEVKVLDFGIAKLTARDGDAARSGGLTNTGALLGTPYYMSPEQVFGDGEVDARSDVWSIGVVLYECLAGVRPTQADSIGQIIRILASDAITPLALRKPELPVPVTDAVMRALSFDHAVRPTLPELRAALAPHAAPAVTLVVA